MAAHPFDRDTLTAVFKLKDLKHQLGTKIESRIEFATLVFKYDLYDEITTYVLYDDFHLSDRDLDTCFEMGDSREVIYSVMKEAVDTEMMKKSILSMGGSVWEQWLTIYGEYESQLDLFA